MEVSGGNRDILCAACHVIIIIIISSSNSIIRVLTYTELYGISCIERFYRSLNQGRIGGQGSGNIDWNPSFRYVNMVLQSRWISSRGGQAIARMMEIRLPRYSLPHKLLYRLRRERGDKRLSYQFGCIACRYPFMFVFYS